MISKLAIACSTQAQLVGSFRTLISGNVEEDTVVGEINGLDFEQEKNILQQNSQPLCRGWLRNSSKTATVLPYRATFHTTDRRLNEVCA